MSTTFPFTKVVEIQTGRIQTQDYKPLGRIVWISMELQFPDGHRPTLKEKLIDARFDFQDVGPLLAMSHDHADLLLPSGIVPLPKIPDPTWIPRTPTQKEIEAKDWKPPVAPMIEQHWTDRPSIDGGTGPHTFGSGKEIWIVFRPIMEVWYRPFGVATYAKVNCKPQAWTGERTALAIQPETGKAHFFGGVFEIA